MAKPKRFCVNGHDTEICGRHPTARFCNECYRERRALKVKRTRADRNQYCPRGHDKDLLGRYEKDQSCLQCMKDKRVKVRKKRTPKQFCPAGHDTFVVGRHATNSSCLECMRTRSLSRGKRTRADRSQFCPKGHDKPLLGKRPDGGCKECLRLIGAARLKGTKAADKLRRRFCKRGHDTLLKGGRSRGNAGNCKECVLENRRIKRPPKNRFRQFCKNGHDTSIEGRGSSSTCRTCLRLRAIEKWPETYQRYKHNFLRASSKRRAIMKQVKSEPYDVKAMIANITHCILCMKPLLPADKRDVEHLVPISRGGEDTPANVTIAHRACNRKKKDMTLGEFWTKFCITYQQAAA